ncbi:hypothetical protein DB346_11115 [Verrucomicrobia bacterium LW23]|nr:hypothetical protein DB346_11115 [Verrucomicrobia bacterium LW23]
MRIVDYTPGIERLGPASVSGIVLVAALAVVCLMAAMAHAAPSAQFLPSFDRADDTRKDDTTRERSAARERPTKAEESAQTDSVPYSPPASRTVEPATALPSLQATSPAAAPAASPAPVASSTNAPPAPPDLPSAPSTNIPAVTAGAATNAAPLSPPASAPPVEAPKPLSQDGPLPAAPLVYVLTLDDDVSPLMELKARRGVKEAIEKKADVLILRIDTNGGRVDSTQNLVKIISRFPYQSRTYAYVDNRALSAGAMIAASTRHIYMAPTASIGAASPILMNPQDGKVLELPKLVQGKFLSAMQAMARGLAEANGHNAAVLEAMVNPEVEVRIDGRLVHAKGQVLTLTARDAEAKYGNPPRPLLSAGTVASVDELVRLAGGPNARTATFQVSGFEEVARILVDLSPLLIMAAVVLAYLEMQKPGTMIFGGLAALCFLLQFFAHHVAGLTGFGPLILFVIGTLLVLAEILLLPGIFVLGATGFFMMVAGLILSMTDTYPSESLIPSAAALFVPMVNVTAGIGLAIIAVVVIARFMPRRVLFAGLEAATFSGSGMASDVVAGHHLRVGDEGEAISMLRPSGTARFGGVAVDVVTEGVMVPRGARVVIEKLEGMRTVVRPVEVAAADTPAPKARLEL